MWLLNILIFYTLQIKHTVTRITTLYLTVLSCAIVYCTEVCRRKNECLLKLDQNSQRGPEVCMNKSASQEEAVICYLGTVQRGLVGQQRNAPD